MIVGQDLIKDLDAFLSSNSIPSSTPVTWPSLPILRYGELALKPLLCLFCRSIEIHQLRCGGCIEITNNKTLEAIFRCQPIHSWRSFNHRPTMRIRIRGPSGGSSTATLDDDATIETLRKTITTETSLTCFDVKYGYPPKTLQLDQYPPSQLLTSLEVKLNGEQLIVNSTESNKGLAQRRGSGDRPTPSPSDTRASVPLPPATSKDVTAPAPLSLSRKTNPAMDDPPEVMMPEEGGTLVLRIMPDDNSCLFRAIASAVISDLDAVTELRSVVAQTIQAHPEKYSKAILDNKEPDQYCRWIQSEDAWGGQIELDILSQHFHVEICSIDVQTLRVDRYNQGARSRCLVVYSGIHYDAIALSPFATSEPEFDQRQFEPPLADAVLVSAVKLCQKLQERHYYTDTAGFSIQCGDCGAICVGESGATKHAEQTGHYNFTEATSS